MVLHIEKRKKTEKEKNYKSNVAKSIKLQFLYLLIHFLM